MAKKKFYKSKGNFTIKRLHQSGGYGNIYERDYTTITPSTPSTSSQLPIYNGPAFKLTVGTGLNKQKKYRYGKWLENPNSCGGTNAWTLGCIPVSNHNDSKINVKTSSFNLKDYACYGSVYELIKASLNDIMIKFPAEIYTSTQTLDDLGILDLGGIDETSLLYRDKDKYSKFFVVKNPMSIDIIQSSMPEKTNLPPLRYFCESQYDYVVMDENNEVIVDGSEIKKWNEEYSDEDKKFLWHVDYEPDKECIVNGDKLAHVSFLKPNENGDYDTVLSIECFYYDKDILYLSRKSQYKVRPNNQVIDNFFDELDDFEKVLLNRNTNYTANFETYVEDNEIGWYSTIKKYQWPTDDGDWNLTMYGGAYSMYINDLSKLAIGYDSLYTNAIWRDMTHEAISNSDLFEKITTDDDAYHNTTKIKKILSIIGRQFDEIKKYVDNIKNTNTVTYDGDNNIPDYFIPDTLELSGWETKMILNGISNDIISEPIYKSRTKGFNVNDANIEFMKRLKLNSKNIFSSKGTKRCIESLLAIFGLHSTDWIEKYYGKLDSKKIRNGFILKEFIYVSNGYSNNVNPDIIADRVREINHYKSSYIDEGGEGDVVVNQYQGLPVVEVFYDGKTRLVPWFNTYDTYDNDMYFQMKGGWGRNDGNNKNELSRYDYTISKIHFVHALDELYDVRYYLLNENDVYYVNNTNDYYKLVNISEHDNSNGWEKLSEEEIFLLESVIDDNKGNNPHYGQYDNGSSYFEILRDFFKKSNFDGISEDKISDRNKYGFKIKRQTDSMKTLFFGNNTNIKDYEGLRGKINITPYNFFDGDIFDETASLSIINSKEFHIIFDDSRRDFIENDVLPYLKQIIPSTTIFSYSFERLESVDGIYEGNVDGLTCLYNTTPILGVVG